MRFLVSRSPSPRLHNVLLVELRAALVVGIIEGSAPAKPAHRAPTDAVLTANPSMPSGKALCSQTLIYKMSFMQSDGGRFGA